jgi:cytochrome P450
MHKAYEAWAQKYATQGVFKVFWAGIPHVVVTDPEHARRMLTASSMPFLPIVAKDNYEAELLANQLLFLHGEEWKERRAPFTQFLANPAKLEKYLPFMLTSIDRFVEQLAPSADAEEPIDIWWAILFSKSLKNPNDT